MHNSGWLCSSCGEYLLARKPNSERKPSKKKETRSRGSKCPPQIARKIEEWQAKLIDLTRRNRGLYYKPTKSSTLVVSQPDAETVFDRLVVKQKGWQFWLPPEEKEENQNAEEQKTRVEMLPKKEPVRQAKRPKKTELVCEIASRAVLDKILKNLYRRSRSAYEERGLRVLYVVLGMLVWKEKTTSEESKSPLLLVPAELKRKTAQDPFELSSAEVEYDPKLNPTLQEKLSRDFNIQLPPLPEDWGKTRLSTYLTKVEKKVAKYGWTVERSATIGIFAFHKLTLYEDLGRNAEAIASSPVVASLAGFSNDDLAVDGLVTERELDIVQQPAESYQILDADSSQQLCIQHALQGQSFVLQGPPGTGKSQTIANIIAEFVARGKTVLFASEKMAALEVVYKRLRESDLAQFCLELHSHKANKREVVAKLERTLNYRPDVRKDMSSVEFEQLSAAKEELNEYVHQLHIAREPLQQSVRDVLDTLADLEHIPDVPFSLPDIRNLTPEKLRTLEDAVSRLQGVWGVVEEQEEFPWFGYRVVDDPHGARMEVEKLCAQILEGTKELIEEADLYASQLGLPRPNCLSDTQRLIRIGELLADNPVPHRLWLVEKDTGRFVNEAQAQHKKCARYSDLRSHLQEGHGVGFLTLREGIGKDIHNRLDSLLPLIDAGPEARQRLLQEIDALKQFVRETQDGTEAWLRGANKLCEELALPSKGISFAQASDLAEQAQLCSSGIRPEESWLDEDMIKRVRDCVQKVQSDYETYRDRRARLVGRCGEGFLSIDIQEIVDKFDTFYRDLVAAALSPYQLARDRTAAGHLVPSAVLGTQDDLSTAFHKNRQDLKKFAQKTRKAAQGWLRDVREILGCLNLPICSMNVHKARDLAELAQLSYSKIRPDRSWLKPGKPDQVRKVAGKARRLYTEHARKKSRLLERYHETFLSLDARKLLQDVSEGCLRWFGRFVPRFWRTRKAIRTSSRTGAIPPTAAVDLDALAAFQELTDKLEAQEQELGAVLGDYFKGYETDFEAIDRALGVADRALKLTGALPVPEEALDALSTKALPDISLRINGTQLKDALDKWENELKFLLRFFPSDGMDDLCAAMKEEDLSALENWAGKLEAELEPLRDVSLEHLVEAEALRELDKQLRREQGRVRDVLGRFYKGYETDFEDVQQALEIAEKALSFAPLPWEAITRLSEEGESSLNLKLVGTQLQNALAQWEQSLASVAELIPEDRLPGTSLSIREAPLDEVAEWASKLDSLLRQLQGLIEELLRHVQGKSMEDVAELVDDLSLLDELRAIEAGEQEDAEELRHAFGEHYQGLETDWNEILAKLDWVKQLQQLTKPSGLSERLVELAIRGPGPAAQSEDLAETYETVATAISDIDSRFSNDQAIFSRRRRKRESGSGMAPQSAWPRRLAQSPGGVDVRQIPFQTILNAISELSERSDELQDWLDFKSLETQFDEWGLTEFLRKLIKEKPDREQLLDTVRKAAYTNWLEAVRQEDRVLDRFRVQHHEKLINKFRELDRKLVDLAPRRAISKLIKNRPESNYVTRTESEVSLIRREAKKKRRHMPIRVLFNKTRNMLLHLKPCLMMSPLSVSQFLPPESGMFDLVIFDEASQIRPQDAIGAIYRGKQVIVAGDDKQLPPTTFFETGVTSDDYDTDEWEDEEYADFDSILDECSSIDLPVNMLKWHYRSKHESLISFSNAQFYENKLVTFPSVVRGHEALGVKFVHVPDGVYDRGKGRNNVREAQVVADLVFDQIARYPKKTVGVVAFSQAQMTAIEDEIEIRRQQHPEFEAHFREDRLEGLFVKNLENVQGDERDVIFFSVGYGPDNEGRLRMNFGPVSRQGGQRRLNVAVTRAREKVVLVSSIKASDMNIQAVSARGTLDLYHYLDYAEKGEVALALDRPQGRSGEYESPLEKSVANAIRSLGYEAVPQVGCSGYRIDLGVIDPAEPGRYILGVECDGATYHSAHTARDRDRLRQQILEGMGWRIYRIWSPDWTRRRQTEMKRLEEAIKAAKRSVKKTSKGVPWETGQPERNKKRKAHVRDTTASKDATSSARGKPKTEDKGYLPETVPYRVYKPRPSRVFDLDFASEEDRDSQCEMLVELVDVEGPIHIDVAARRLARGWQLYNVTKQVASTVRDIASRCCKKKSVRKNGNFLWPPSLDFAAVPVRTPDPGDKDSKRKLEHIPKEEIQKAMLLIVKHTIGIPLESLLVETSRVFGIGRTTEKVKDKLRRRCNELLRSGRLEKRGESLVSGRAAE